MSRANVLAINGGSSSIKFALFGIEGFLSVKLRGEIKRIGLPNPVMHLQDASGEAVEKRVISAPDFQSAVSALTTWMGESQSREPLSAIGHRIVHGGPRFNAPELLSAEVLSELQALSAFDPEHLPTELSLVRSVQKMFSEVPQVACFDTEFHHDLPNVARLLAIPRRYEKLGVRRYGFHGLSYSYLLGELSKLDDQLPERENVILAHLGSGASLAALKNGKSIDTSMGFTPASGVVMSTRSGDIDPGLALYLQRSANVMTEDLNEILNFNSGLLGISETTADMEHLLGIEGSDTRALDAVAMFCYQVKKYIGAYAAALGGLDILVFSGGIGENSAVIRARACQGLEFLGIEIDPKKNDANSPVISSDESRVVIRIIRTDEERMIAEKTVHALNLF